jgi:acetyl esterase/lipase
MKKIILPFSLLLQFSMSAFSQTEFPLYKGAIPNSIRTKNAEKSETSGGILRISKVSQPTLSVYLPSKDKANGTAVIICPGGGYGILAASHEGSDVAKRFADMGVTAFVVKYRLPDDSTMPNKEIGPLQDAQQAIKTVRERASEWGIDVNKIGIMGFSAGGHLASTAGTHFYKSLIPNKENTSVRPDFLLLIYPVISFSNELTHMGSRNNLIGTNPTEDKINEYSNELQVQKDTPPTFLVHASDDGAVKPGNSIQFYEALLRNNVKAELHLYQAGGHGFGMHMKNNKEEWMESCKNWMTFNGWIK